MTIYTNTSLTNSSSDQEYFLKHLNEFGKIKEISCVFDVDNFIFFEDTETESRFTFIAKTYNGNKIFLKSVNCGYVGSGPNAFRIILEGLGVPKKVTYEIYTHSAVKIYFDSDGKYENYILPKYFIDPRPQNNKILPCYAITNMTERKLYLVNPEKYMSNLYQLLSEFIPYKIEYWIGYDSELDHSYRLDTKENRAIQIDRDPFYKSNKKIKTVDHFLATQVSLILYGENYDLLLLVPMELQISFLESILLFYNSSSFLNTHSEELKATFHHRKLKRWIKKSTANHMHGEIKLEILNHGCSSHLL